MKWYLLSAEQGNASAQSSLGYNYYVGTGVIKDKVYAHMWWSIAASRGDKNAIKNRGVVEGEMTPTQMSAAQKLARECIRKKYKGCVPVSPGSAGVSESADFQKGLTAYESADFVTALREWKPLAKQGNASAQYFTG